MKPWAEACVRGLRSGGAVLFSFALWAVWLALLVLLGVQVYILTSNELTLPPFVLRKLESRLAESGLRATFNRTSFDPTGRVLIENVRLSPVGFDDPVVTARAVYLRLNPWWLTVGRVELREARFTEVAAAVPALFSGTGRPEPIVTGLDAIVEPSNKEIVFRQFNGRVAGIVVSAHGRLMLAPARGASKPTSEVFRDFVAQRFAAVCRQAMTVAQYAAQFEQPSLHLEFAPSESGAATIHLQALARSAQLPELAGFELKFLRASTRFLVFGDAPASDIELSVGELNRPGELSARGVQARLLGRLQLDGSQFDPRELAVTADAVTTGDIEIAALAARVFSKGPPRFETRAIASVFGAPLAVNGEADFGAKHGTARFEGQISPRVLDLVSTRANTNIRRFFDFETLTADRGEVSFADDWKFARLTARIRVPVVNAYGIAMQDGRVALELDPRRFFAPEAFARVGDNFARGSYEHDLTTHQYRFLLDGQLRPLDISRWFREWWPAFFQQLGFPNVPPSASVDVRSSWRDGRSSNVFVFADSGRTVVRDVAFDRVRTRLFIRPAFFDGLELLAVRGDGEARGRFTHLANPATNEWRSFDLSVRSNLGLSDLTRLLGTGVANTLAPFQVAGPPELDVQGRFVNSEAGPAGTQLRITARTTGDFRFYDFPLRDVSFVALLDRDDIVVDQAAGRFGDGTFTGHARVSGQGDQRRVGFDFSLGNASLGQVAGDVGDFLARRAGRPPGGPDKFVQEKANVRLDLSAAAEGRYDNILSYRGEGNAFLHGPGLGEVPLLGALSELLKFTSLRFTEARSTFKIDGSRLSFPAVTIRGSNSAVAAHGTYALDQSTLDFNAKLFPFQESENFLKTVVGAVLTPLSNAFEVKLTGSPTKPNWAFVRGPSNLLRSLAGGNDNAPRPETPGDEKPPETPAPGPEKPAPLPAP